MPENRAKYQHPLKLPEHKINPLAPWDGDLLGRKEIARRLTDIVETVEEPFRISLHGPWGSGKTWLLRRWEKGLETQGLHAAYYNAWEDDLCRDPLVGILGQLHLKLRHLGYTETLRAIGKATAAILGAAAEGAMARYAGINVSQVVTALRNDPLEMYARERESLTTLTRLLEVLAANTKARTGKPLVFIIDELERCRPAYAAECLERVKHVMEVPGLVFVLGINRDQLCDAIQRENGIKDPSTYLQRFFDLELNLPEASPEHFCRAKLNELGITYDPDVKPWNEAGYEPEKAHRNEIASRLLTGLPAVCRTAGLTPREMEHCVRMTTLAIRTMGTSTPSDTDFLLVLPILKLKNPELYRRYTKGRCRTVEVTHFLDDLTWGKTDDAVTNLLMKAELALMRANQTHDGKAAESFAAIREGREPENPATLPQLFRKIDRATAERLADEASENPLSITMMTEYLDLHQVPPVL